jgi:hypothetical protein
MRTIQWLVGFAGVGALAGMLVAGCGDDTAATPPQDAGTDHTTVPEASPMPDTGAGTDSGSGDDSATDAGMEACVSDADLTMLMVPDAAIGDSSATVPNCYACILATCQTELTACSADCDCVAGVNQYLTCVSTPGTTGIGCGIMLAQGTNPNGAALGLCVAGPAFGGTGAGCLAQCGVSVPVEAGTEAGTEGGTEGGTEAGTEAGSEGGEEAGPTEAGGDAPAE